MSERSKNLHQTASNIGFGIGAGLVAQAILAARQGFGGLSVAFALLGFVSLLIGYVEGKAALGPPPKRWTLEQALYFLMIKREPPSHGLSLERVMEARPEGRPTGELYRAMHDLWDRAAEGEILVEGVVDGKLVEIPSTMFSYGVEHYYPEGVIVMKAFKGDHFGGAEGIGPVGDQKNLSFTRVSVRASDLINPDASPYPGWVRRSWRNARSAIFLARYKIERLRSRKTLDIEDEDADF